MSERKDGEAAHADRDETKRQGDKLGVGQASTLQPGSASPSGDGLKQQGDKLERAVKEAAKG